MLNTDNLLQNYQAGTAAKIESLAKLYLEGIPDEVSDATIAQFCDWLWGEDQSLPSEMAGRTTEGVSS